LCEGVDLAEMQPPQEAVVGGDAPVQRIEAALDPNGIIAPGRYCPLP